MRIRSLLTMARPGSWGRTTSTEAGSPGPQPMTRDETRHELARKLNLESQGLINKEMVQDAVLNRELSGFATQQLIEAVDKDRVRGHPSSSSWWWYKSQSMSPFGPIFGLRFAFGAAGCMARPRRSLQTGTFAIAIYKIQPELLRQSTQTTFPLLSQPTATHPVINPPSHPATQPSNHQPPLHFDHAFVFQFDCVVHTF